MAIRASTYVHVARTGCQLLARRVVPSLCLLRTLLQSASELYRVVQSPTQPPIITRFWASEARPPKGMRHGAAHQARHHTYNTCVITGQTICFLELLRDAARARKACTYWKLVASPSVWASFSTSGTLRIHHLCSPPNPHYHIRSLTAHMSSGKRISSKVSKQLTPNERSQPGIHSTLSAGRVGKFQTLTRDGNCLQHGVGKNGIRVQERFPPPDRAIGRASW